MLPEGNTLSTRSYDAKKILSHGYEVYKIQTCPNDCVLYKNEFDKLHQCPQCGYHDTRRNMVISNIILRRVIL